MVSTTTTYSAPLSFAPFPIRPLTNCENKPMIQLMTSSEDKTPDGPATPSPAPSMTPSEDAAWREIVEADSQALKESVNAAIAEAKRRGVPLHKIIPVH